MLRYKTETRSGLVAFTTSGQETERVNLTTPEPARDPMGVHVTGHPGQLSLPSFPGR